MKTLKCHRLLAGLPVILSGLVVSPPPARRTSLSRPPGQLAETFVETWFGERMRHRRAAQPGPAGRRRARARSCIGIGRAC